MVWFMYPKSLGTMLRNLLMLSLKAKRLKLKYLRLTLKKAKSASASKLLLQVLGILQQAKSTLAM
ncbi:hypothetical protein D3C86_2002170 [compost metagenome]